MIKFDFTNKNVIVTGSSMGLGKEIAKQFAIAHANVIIADLNLEAAEQTKKELEVYGTKILTYPIDVSSYSKWKKLANFANQELGNIDILVNNAGICSLEPIADMDIDKLNKMLAVNLNGTIYGCKTILPIMKKQGGGRVVNMSSIASRLASANGSIYSVTKAGVLELTACLGREYAKDNITVNCVLPGIIRTPLWEGMLDTMTNGDNAKKDTTFTTYTDTIPTGRPQDPIDIAMATLFLCTEEAYNINCQNLAVDGGHTF